MHESLHVASVWFGWDAQWVSAGILLLTYAALISEKVHRTVAALLGGSVMILVGVIDQPTAITGIDFNTIALLTGMMVLVAITRQSGLFEYVAIKSAKLVRADPRGILVMLSFVTALFSAFLDNVTTVLLIVPVTLLIVEKLDLPPYPFFLAEIFASNIGGTATLIGDPPNILIGSSVGLSFTDFLLELGPAAVVIQIAVLVVIHLGWGRKLHASLRARGAVMRFHEKDSITDKTLLVRSLVVLGAVIVLFLAAEHVHIANGTVAMLGASTLLLLTVLGRRADEQNHKVEEALREVEWTTLLFFIGLFVLVHGVEHSGLLAEVGEVFSNLTKGNLEAAAFSTLWLSAFASAIVDNIPFVATMIPVIESMGPSLGGEHALAPVWWALSLGACLGGNGSLIGSTANVIVAGFAERIGQPISFMKFLAIGMPVTVLCALISTVYLYIRHFM